LADLVLSLSETMDMVSPQLVGHQHRVAVIAGAIGAEMGLAGRRLNTLILAGALHDIGAFSLRERLDCLQFEIEKPHEHAWMGSFFLRGIDVLAEETRIVSNHHLPWDEDPGEGCGGRVHPGSHLIHLADRISVLVDPEREILSQRDEIVRRIRASSGSMFNPQAVEAFESVAVRQSFWFDLPSPDLGRLLRKVAGARTVPLSIGNLLGLSQIFARIIDYRSHFTASHSAGVASVAEKLALYAGFSEARRLMIRLAGFLHDLGKLAVPSEIIEKKGKLTGDEYNRVMRHTYFTSRAFERFEGFDEIRTWAAFHHERLDGTGYPFHLAAEELSPGSRILAVADVYAALTENRPYRQGMDPVKAVGVLHEMVRLSQLDAAMVELLAEHLDEVEQARLEAQGESLREYREMMSTVRKKKPRQGPAVRSV
jgi:HD-GYP domain-containing protein (c-di-GMP phosphodiesterase class II)